MNDSRIVRVAGRAVPVPGDDIDTDRIIPARYLRCVTFEGLGEHAFEDDRRQDPGHPFNQEQYRGASILIVGRNFGCGSSREHAPEALHRWGIRGIVGHSFAEIFFGNCVSMGVPCVRLEDDDRAALVKLVQADPTVEAAIDVEAGRVTAGGRTFAASIPPAARDRLVTGTWDALGELLAPRAEILEMRRKIQYLNFR
jgi:3-isopropylmalate/(R)-2-methylmalate dehydratase small subunit